MSPTTGSSVLQAEMCHNLGKLLQGRCMTGECEAMLSRPAETLLRAVRDCQFNRRRQSRDFAGDHRLGRRIVVGRADDP